jgi:hypothetical protein
MIEWRPSAKQTEFLSAAEDEVLYGGAAGGGKSAAMLVDALGLQQDAPNIPSYRALIIRQTMPQLRELIDRSRVLYPLVIPGAEFFEQPKEWRFPSGAKVIFGSCERDADVLQYQGQEYQWIGVDELGQYRTPYVWNYLSSRLRTSHPGLKCYMRATCNPGPKWIRERWGFSPAGEPSRQVLEVKLDSGAVVSKTLRFIPARLHDNPHLGVDYEANLQRLPEAERAALMLGRWDVIDVPGAIYGDVLKAARDEGRICGVPYDAHVPVHTYWDIGINDATSIWFCQRVGREWHVIDYYERRNASAAEHAAAIKAKPYAYGDHWLPHDAEAREKGTGKTYREILASHGIRARITPSISLEEGIAALRMMFNQLWFDAKRCEEGLNALQYYRRDWKDRAGEFTTPVHDWSSHTADALRYFAVASSKAERKWADIQQPQMAIV